MLLPCLRQLLLIMFTFVLTSCAHVEKSKAHIKSKLSESQNSKHVIDDDAYSSLALMMQVMQMLHENYVDADAVTYKQLIDNGIKGMVGGLDPYSQYFEPEIFDDVEKENTGMFGGIGVVLRTDKKGLLIMSVNKGGPAERAGVKVGDIITAVDSKSISNMDFRECLEQLKGRPGTDVEIKLYRGSDKSEHRMLITREVIKISPVSGVKLISDKIGYIKLSQFTRPTVEELDKALNKLKAEGMNALIFDLRNNPGGFVDSAIEVCSRFIEKGKLVVFTKGRDDTKKKEFNSVDCKTKVLDIPMVILINDMSASASEIVSGCLKDYKRAVLVGEKSFGKGSVQSVVNLSNKGGIKFTIAKYYTPKAYVIHGVGIEPDINIPVKEKDKHRLALQMARYPGEIKPKYKGSIEDVQLERAIEVLKGVLIYKKSGL